MRTLAAWDHRCVHRWLISDCSLSSRCWQENLNVCRGQSLASLSAIALMKIVPSGEVSAHDIASTCCRRLLGLCVEHHRRFWRQDVVTAALNDTFKYRRWGQCCGRLRKEVWWVTGYLDKGEQNKMKQKLHAYTHCIQIYVEQLRRRKGNEKEWSIITYLRMMITSSVSNWQPATDSLSRVWLWNKYAHS